MTILSVEKSSEIQSTLLAFAKKTVEKFLSENSEKVFYAMAFECNLTYCEFGICFNTESDFSDCLNHYRKEYPEYYQSPKDIQGLKYNTGDWAYHYIDVLYFMEEDEYGKIFKSFGDDEEFYEQSMAFIDELKSIVKATLNEFKQTPIYQKIAKTDDFIAFVIDHDDDSSEVLAEYL